MITVTPTAASKISELLAEENKQAAALRVFVQGGGCSGFQYGLMIDEVVGAEVPFLTEEDVDDEVAFAGALAARGPEAVEIGWTQFHRPTFPRLRPPRARCVPGPG